MKYHEITIHVSDESREALISKLSDAGTLGFVEKEGAIVAYFDDQKNLRQISDEILTFKAVLKDSGLDPDISIESSTLAEQDWNEEWKKSFSPIDIGENIVIVPSWIRHKTDRMVITIDPGQAFGIGNHETTVRCLEILEKHSAYYQGGSLLDIGTGTGILAIGALKLGFVKATGVDIDPPAVEAAKWNADLNGLKDVDIRLGDIHKTSGNYDFITANLISDILIRIAHDIVSRLKKGGRAVLSGMLSGQEDAVITAIEHEGLRLQEKFNDDKWVTLLFS